VCPVFDLPLRYVQAARFGQQLRVRPDLVEWRNRLKIHYLISDAQSGARMTRASTVQVAVSLADGTMQLVSPQIMIDSVERHLPRNTQAASVTATPIPVNP
jgi:acyl-CoA thioester hydrolase